MSGRPTATPLEIAAVEVAPAVTGQGGYATLSKDRVLRLAQSMPDCQSAVLLLLAWQATLHEKMKRGRFAGRAEASLSGAAVGRDDRPSAPDGSPRPQQAGRRRPDPQGGGDRRAEEHLRPAVPEPPAGRAGPATGYDLIEPTRGPSGVFE